MKNKIINRNKSFLSFFLILGLVISLFLGDTSSALAARSGGRIGGGAFRAPTRSAPAPSRGGGGFPAPGYGGGFGGGGFGFPFLIPFMAFGGGGSLFTVLIFLTIAGFLVNSFKSIAAGSSSNGDSYGSSYDNPPVSVTKVQVGLLATARELQGELNEIANHADTGTGSGRAQVLQEATLALLRHPEYWVYGSTEAEIAPLTSAEAKFNQFSLSERSKFTEETLSNVNNQLKEVTPKALPNALIDGNGSYTENLKGNLTSSGEYILVTILAGVEGKIEVPVINDAADLRKVLQAIGGLGSDRLLAIEVLWTPQSVGDTLTTDDIQAFYPNLKLV